jgi:hypothetical protein
VALVRDLVDYVQNGWQVTFDPDNPLAVDDEDNLSTYD